MISHEWCSFFVVWVVAWLLENVEDIFAEGWGIRELGIYLWNWSIEYYLPTGGLSSPMRRKLMLGDCLLGI